jgi:hypothetical protein
MEHATKYELNKMRDSAIEQIDVIDKTSIYSIYYLRNASKRAELVAFLSEIDNELLYKYDNERRAISKCLQQRDPLRCARQRQNKI